MAKFRYQELCFVFDNLYELLFTSVDSTEVVF